MHPADTLTLLVDDNLIQASTRTAILQRAGQKVIIAGDGASALKLIEDPKVSNMLGLVITDHLMPGMNGVSLVTRLRAILPSVPVLVLSGLPNVEDEYRGMNVVFRSKPFPPDALIALTRQMLEEPLGRIA
jgi:DNA-binding response OmpR family regulator